jgi:hypothetical protein
VTTPATLHRCVSNPERVCRAQSEGCCKRCGADGHNPQLHRLHRAASAIGVPYDVLRRAVSNGALDG